VILRTSDQELVAYYESKTQTILRRYGPGPRVHYHTGLVDVANPSPATARTLREDLVAAQELTLRYAAELWRVRSIAFEEVLDVGCGLGGGAIFWAQEFNAHVTAITIAPSHLYWVEKFATEAGVQSRVQPLLCDALQVPGDRGFDAVIAIDSSSSFPRKGWFKRLAEILRPGGHVLITDCFLERTEYQDLFNRHWCSTIGTIGEYRDAARNAGLREELVEDVSHLAAPFWTMTLDLIKCEAQRKTLSVSETAKVEESVRAHGMVRQGLVDGGLRYALMSFRKD